MIAYNIGCAIIFRYG